MTYPIHVLCSSGTVKFLFRRLIGIFWASYYTKLWLLLVFYGAVLMQPSSGVQELFKIGFACNVSKTTSSNLCSSELNKIFKDNMYELKKQGGWELDFRPGELTLPENIYHSMMSVCVAVEGGEGGRIRAVIADVDNDALSGLLLVTNHFKIPVISIRPRSTVLDPMLSSYYLSVFPSRATSASLIQTFLRRYALSQVGIVANSLYLSSNYYSLTLNKTLTRDPKVSVEWMLHYDPDQVNALDVISRFRDSSRVAAILVLLPLSNMAPFFSVLKESHCLHAHCGTGHDWNGTEINNYIWIFPDISFSDDPSIMRHLPLGSISFYSALKDDPSDVVSALTEVVMGAAESARKNLEVLGDLSGEPVRPEINTLTCLRDQDIQTHVKQGQELLRVLKQSSFTVKNNSKYKFDSDGFNSNGFYRIVNLIKNPNIPSTKDEYRIWRQIGTYQPDQGGLKLDTILWPGGSPLLPDAVRIADTEKIRLVLKLSLPFVMQTAQYNEESEQAGIKCRDVGIQCLNISSFTVDPDQIQKYLDGKSADKVDVLCCYGFTVEVLKSLANDLNFKYQAFLTPEATIGSYTEGQWRGMIGDILRDSADMAAGATSITPQRAEAIQFSVPYYSSAFGTLSARKPPRPATSAFMDPFSPAMWILIFIFVHVTAIFMAFFEWLSPYGLHPNGRNRRSVFSFPSGLLHTWSLLFSHTYASKPPKSVASRIIVNAWGMFAVVFIAGYTANLASFMAGRMLDPNIDISKLRYPDSDMKFATINGTSTEYYLQLYFPQRYREFKKNNVKSLAEGVAKLKSYEIGALMFDAPQVEYEAATDPDCTLIAAGSNFWSDTYGLMFPKHSNLVNQINERLVNYEATGMITTWEKKWLTTPSGECYSPMMSRYRLSFDHAHGVFILILVGSLFALFVLGIEWLVYKLVVPCLKQHEYSGKWKYILFFSQRLNASLKTAPKLSKKKHSIIGLVDSVHSNVKRTSASSPSNSITRLALLRSSTTGSFKSKKVPVSNQNGGNTPANLTLNPGYSEYHQMAASRTNNLSTPRSSVASKWGLGTISRDTSSDVVHFSSLYSHQGSISPHTTMPVLPQNRDDSSLFDSCSSLSCNVPNRANQNNSGAIAVGTYSEHKDPGVRFPIIVKSPSHNVGGPSGEFKTGIEIVQTHIPNGFISAGSSRDMSPMQTQPEQMQMMPITVNMPSNPAVQSQSVRVRTPSQGAGLSNRNNTMTPQKENQPGVPIHTRRVPLESESRSCSTDI
ncbi:glutamate receptor ionotropic, NMDA 1-like isoform X2 [Symsagittifera roscoffensis]|uniref:glutamate receptor ionotropic, NMDA 1-like isoform X2 n=1 Tax=Symsagittifera roscoffensis TaxID=84072 RepID=UPI00307B94F3